MYKKIVVYLILGAICIGCGPRVRVIAKPTINDNGIRYYRPKPYLLITSAGETQVKVEGEAKVTTTKPNEKYVNVQLQYLPDFEEEYAIEVKPGLGSADVSLTLEQGWNLTSVNQKLDSQTDENLKAAAELVGSISKAATGASIEKGTSGTSNPAFQAMATNVPLGYYESVIGRDQCGKKRLYGFRYIGFMPFQNCPTIACGTEQVNCQTSELYGLVFHNGVMCFKPLTEVQQIVPDFPPAEPQKGVEVQRTLQYSLPSGDPKTATIQVTDKFSSELENDGRLKIGLPELQPR